MKENIKQKDIKLEHCNWQLDKINDFVIAQHFLKFWVLLFLYLRGKFDSVIKLLHSWISLN